MCACCLNKITCLLVRTMKCCYVSMNCMVTKRMARSLTRNINEQAKDGSQMDRTNYNLPWGKRRILPARTGFRGQRDTRQKYQFALDRGSLRLAPSSSCSKEAAIIFFWLIWLHELVRLRLRLRLLTWCTSVVVFYDTVYVCGLRLLVFQYWNQKQKQV